MKSIPIVIPCYNRIEPLKRLLVSLENAIYNEETPLIFSIDYSGSNDIYNYINNFQWNHGEKFIIQHSSNIGLKSNILYCGDLTKKYDAVIILEDDLIVAQDFYNFAIQAYNFYKDEEIIAGISLYKYERAEIDFHQFYPIETNSDVYLMRWPSSWGQMWTKRQWNNFRIWLETKDNIEKYNIPDYVKDWNRESWKKWAVAYLSSTGRYYVYPYKSFTNEFGTIGTHYSAETDIPNRNTVSLFSGQKQVYNFEPFDKLPKYDCFFQPISRRIIINEKIYDTTINIYNCRKKKNITTEYVISPIKIEDNHIINTYPLLNIPIELNLDLNCTIDTPPFFYLYKTIYFKENKLNYNQKIKLRILCGAFETIKYALLKRLRNALKIH